MSYILSNIKLLSMHSIKAKQLNIFCINSTSDWEK